MFKFIVLGYKGLRFIIHLCMNAINFLSNDIPIKYNVLKTIKGRLFLSVKGKLVIGKNVRINSRFSANPIGGQSFTSIVVKKNCVLSIKDNVAISNSSIFCSDRITIMEDVFIGGDCKIYDTDFHSLILENRILDNDPDIKTSPVVIEKGAFIGTHTIILKGVTVGEESIVGAGSIVTKNIPPREIWAGNPAKFIRKLNDTIKASHSDEI